MLVKFKKSGPLREYHGKPDVHFADGEQKELPEEKGKYLLKTFPDNFSEGSEKTDSPEPTKTDPPEDTIAPGGEEKSDATQTTGPEKGTGAEGPEEERSSEQTPPAAGRPVGEE